jgi:hypothetical protein
MRPAITCDTVKVGMLLAAAPDRRALGTLPGATAVAGVSDACAAGTADERNG